MVAEKWREGRLRERGDGVLRFGWADLNRPHETAARIWRGIARHTPGSHDKQQRVARPRRGCSVEQVAVEPDGLDVGGGAEGEDSG
ncbi:hypothetical protein GCM10009742_18430 [Kribbella karoonensis]|uniref:DUF559 domain-containing protein n=1 Tax=Kribbella karoonensis TaxID=324851 RepID=A0ABN2DDL9_9ACTN